MDNSQSTNLVEYKVTVCDKNNNDPKTRVWITFSSKDYPDPRKRAEEWILNFNENARRKREFVIESN